MRIVKALSGWLRGIVKPISRLRKAKTDTKQASFPELRERVRQLTRMMVEARSNFESLQLDLEDYGAESWRREKESWERYYRMAGDLFLLLDHLEILARNEKKSDEVDWVYRKVRRILEDAGIEEIPMKKGDLFSGICHKYMGERQDELPRGTILETTRKGYYMRGQAEEGNVILRPAEVIISSGPSGEQTEGRSSDKEEVEE